MFKLLIILQEANVMSGPAPLHSQVVSFDTEQEAKEAWDALQTISPIGTRLREVLRLYKPTM